MKRSGNWKKQIQLKNPSVLITFAILIVGGLILKVIADRESNARIEY